MSFFDWAIFVFFYCWLACVAAFTVSIVWRRYHARWRRAPAFCIGGKDNPYLMRWWIIPRNRFFNIYLHKFLRSDDDRALHDHPWPSCSFILKGGYREHLPGGVVKRRRAWVPYFRRARQAHRVELHQGYRRVHNSEIPLLHTWTLFITGPKVREWGFHCPKGWVHWKTFCSQTDTSKTEHGLMGRGCE